MLSKPWQKTKAVGQTEGKKIMGSVWDILGLLHEHDMHFTFRETVEGISLKCKRGPVFESYVSWELIRIYE